MANKKITSLTALTTPASGDFIPIVDISDTTDAATGTTKKITQDNLVINASTTVRGAAEEATQAETTAGTAAGGTGARLFVNPSTLAAAMPSLLTNALSIETTTGATHSLTTIAGEKVFVIAKGTCANTAIGSTEDITITIKYNSVVKDTVIFNPGNETDTVPFALIYTETPGAATQNITVQHTGNNATLSNIVIIVLKVKTT